MSNLQLSHCGYDASGARIADQGDRCAWLLGFDKVAHDLFKYILMKRIATKIREELDC